MPSQIAWKELPQVELSIDILDEPNNLKYIFYCTDKAVYSCLEAALYMVVPSQISIVGDGSFGPEAPLVTIYAIVAGMVSLYMFKQTLMIGIRKHTLCVCYVLWYRFPECRSVIPCSRSKSTILSLWVL